MWSKVLSFFLPTLLFAAKLIPPFPLYTHASYKAMWDLNMSPYAGGETLLSANRVLERAEMYFLKKSHLGYSRASQARFWRLSEMVSVWLPLNYIESVIQHEVFGHGYRIRDIGRGKLQVTGYEFGWPPPYGFGGGGTGYELNPDTLTTTEECTVASAGVEATAILAFTTKMKWLEAKKIAPRQVLLYLISEYDLTLYIDTLKDPEGQLEGHDLAAYIDTLNYTYPEHILSKGRLRSLAWINLADPFTFYAAYAFFHYLSSGKESSIPMISSVYLPGFRLGLTPFGPEVFFEQFFRLKNTPFYGYVKGGHHANNGYYGVGAYGPSLYSIQKWHLGMRCDVWWQPKLLLNPGRVVFGEIDFNQTPDAKNPLYSSKEQHEHRFGVAGSLIGAYHGKTGWGGEIECGYKTQGFLPGYSLRSSPTIRLSLSLQF